MKILGITGGMGSGKTTVAAYLRDKGAAVIDCDDLARKILVKGSKGLAEVEKEFGQTVFKNDGDLDRKELARIVFKDKEKLKKLDEITHKYIIEKIAAKINEFKKDKNVSLIVIDAAIPVKCGFIDVTDEVWTVIADKEKRIERVMERSNLTYKEAKDRIDSQIPDEAYTNIADKIIVNNEGLYELKVKVAEMLQDISK